MMGNGVQMRDGSAGAIWLHNQRCVIIMTGDEDESDKDIITIRRLRGEIS